MRLRGGLGWSVAACAALVAGLGLRLLLGGGGVGDRSAMVMAVLLSVGAWLAAMLLGPPRTAFVVALAATALLDVAALPARNMAEYDAREAFFRTDQVISARVANPPDGLGAQAQPTLVLLVEPVFRPDASQPAFGLAGRVANAELVWDCAFQRGLQHLALSLPPATLAGPESLDIQLHLTGSPSRETDYLLVYASAVRGGVIASMGGANDALGTARCTLHS